jgi:CRP/FNR family transcriptional regulator, anaerobic regulatory protein
LQMNVHAANGWQRSLMSGFDLPGVSTLSTFNYQLYLHNYCQLSTFHFQLQRMHELLLAAINRYITLSKEETDYFDSILHARKFKRKEYLLQEGETSKYTTFVTAGILRMYSIDKNGFEHIIQFAPPGWWIGDIQSFLQQKPGNLYIDVIEEAEVIQITRADIDKLYIQVPKFERFYRILAENAVAAYQQRFVNSLSLPARERYQNFCELYPSLIQCLPQKFLASYIGVTPEFLSKMLGSIKPKA